MWVRKFDSFFFYLVFENFIAAAMIWNVYFVQMSPSIVLEIIDKSCLIIISIAGFRMKGRKWPKRIYRYGSEKSKYVVILSVSLHLQLQFFFFEVAEFLEEMHIRHLPDQYL